MVILVIETESVCFDPGVSRVLMNDVTMFTVRKYRIDTLPQQIHPGLVDLQKSDPAKVNTRPSPTSLVFLQDRSQVSINVPKLC